VSDSGTLTLISIIGWIGVVIFSARFYVQWIYSEIHKKSVVPVAFWYLSSVGSLILFGTAIATGSPNGALSQCFNIVVYSRNLVHIWREQGVLTPRRKQAIHVAAGTIALVAGILTLRTWMGEYHATRSMESARIAANWIWLAVGATGQALFALRFLVQWIATERSKKSVVPPIFWHISIAATLLQLGSFMQRGDWIFMTVNVLVLPIYFRNLWFIYARPGETEGDAKA
jgi:lipid-A-disaccharide synthase-like uncharacterized protein